MSLQEKFIYRDFNPFPEGLVLHKISGDLSKATGFLVARIADTDADGAIRIPYDTDTATYPGPKEGEGKVLFYWSVYMTYEADGTMCVCDAETFNDAATVAHYLTDMVRAFGAECNDIIYETMPV